MMKTLYTVFIYFIMHIAGNAQCKPIDFAAIKSYATAADNSKEQLLVKDGFKKASDIYDPDAGIGKSYTACWATYKDGYARFAQQITWFPRYKLLTLTLLDKTNYDQLKASIKKIAKYNGTEPDKTELYQDATFIYSLQVVDFNEPLQKKHPSYVVAIALLKL